MTTTVLLIEDNDITRSTAHSDERGLRGDRRCDRCRGACRGNAGPPRPCPSGPPAPRLYADPGSIEQVLMNLVVDARDAMPTGGKLTIETTNVVLAADTNGHAGPHAMIAVTDTGTGMDASTMTQVFEPFFTTKPHGKGTGLGLSTVFGIVHQANGRVSVRSTLGGGTTFEIYLPISAAEPSVPITPEARPGTRLIFMSGYTDDGVVRHGVLDASLAYVQKPFTPQTLTRKIREVLDA